MPSQLSGGQQQRVAIARAIVVGAAGAVRRRADRQPRHGDQRRDHEAAHRAQRERGITIVMVTHEPDIAAWTRRIVRFRDGVHRERRSQHSGARRAPDVLERHAAGAARDPPQRAALVAHDARHRHRRRRGDHDGDDRRGRDGAGAGRHPEARHEPAAGVSRPGLRRRRWRALVGAAVHDGGRARDRERDLRRRAPSRRARTPSAQAIYGNSNWSTQVTGTSDKYPRRARLAAGVAAATSPRASCAPAPRCACSATPSSRSCSATRTRSACRIRLGKLSCQVIGLLESKGQSGFGQDQDDIVVMPLRTFQRRMAGNSDVGAIFVSARDGVSTEKVQADLERAAARAPQDPRRRRQTTSTCAT